MLNLLFSVFYEFLKQNISYPSDHRAALIRKIEDGNSPRLLPTVPGSKEGRHRNQLKNI